MFQSTRPRGRTRPQIRKPPRIGTARFNPRVLAGGRDDYSPEQPQCHQFQSTRPRGRTRQYHTMLNKRLRVSIHASSREDATAATSVTLIKLLFQSTRPRGRTRQSAVIDRKEFIVSIHASSREDATLCVFGVMKSLKFQSTRPRGRTRRVNKWVLLRQCLFQSTRPRGRTRLRFRRYVKRRNGFNPRVLAGGRDFGSSRKNEVGMFQSTRPRGRTRPVLAVFLRQLPLFQSTRPRGRTRH